MQKNPLHFSRNMRKHVETSVRKHIGQILIRLLGEADVINVRMSLKLKNLRYRLLSRFQGEICAR